MRFYRKKPVVVEAVRWTGKNRDEVNDFLNDGLGEELFRNAPIVIETLESDAVAQVGDWIIKGIQGGFYPCKPDIFEQAYEPA